MYHAYYMRLCKYVYVCILVYSAETMESAQVVASAGIERTKEVAKKGWLQTRLAGM